MRVVHIIDSGGYYGAEVMLVHLCNAQKQLGIDVEVISIGTPGTYEKPIEIKLRENNIACKLWRMMALPDFRESLKILTYCRNTATSVIHSHGYKSNILLGLIPRHWRGLSVIATVHGYTQQKGFSKLAIYQWLDKHCLKRLDAVALVSEGMRHQVDATGLGSKLHVIPNGIPEEIPTAAEKPIEIFEESDFKIAAIGRLSHEKNFQLLIHAIPLILNQVPNAKLVIFGEGGERAQLEALIEELNLNDRIVLPGYIDEPSRVYRHADVFVNSSLTEGMPITLLEAMREGCPIVATDIPANRSLLNDVFENAQLCLLSPSNMAEAILGLTTASRSRSNGLTSRFREQFTARFTAIEYNRLYRENLPKAVSQESNI